MTLYRAAVQADRELVVDLCTHAMAEATGQPSIPQRGHRQLRVFVPFSQRLRVRHTQEFDRVNRIRDIRLFPEDLARAPGRHVLTFRESMIGDLQRCDCLEGARLVWSLWPGYLDRAERLRAFLEAHGIGLVVHHASGHAHARDLERLVTALAPDRVVPIHSSRTDRFADHFPRVECHADGEWWEV